MCDSIRKKVYEEFALEANKNGVEWYVLHGIEGYPEKIGRDLDIFVQSKSDSIKLLEIFKNLLKKHNFLWIIRPNPIWGQRVFGIDSHYNSVELHVINQVRSGIFEFSAFLTPDKKYYAGIFPYNSYLMFCKGCIMPLLARDEKAFFKCDNLDIELPNFPAVFSPLLFFIKNRQKINTSILVRIAGKYAMQYPMSTIRSLWRWLRIKVLRYFAPSGPIILVKNAEIFEVRNELKSKLSEVFTDIVVGNKMTTLEIRKTTALQKAVLLSGERRFVRADIEIDFRNFKDSNNEIKDNVIKKILDCTTSLYTNKVN